MKANASKYHLFLSPCQPIPVTIRGSIIKNSNWSLRFRGGKNLGRNNIPTTQRGIESVSNLGAKLWDLLGQIKKSLSLSIFKNEISKCIPKKCPCKLCQTYLHKTCLLYSFSLRHLLDFPWCFDSKFKSLWESCGMKSFRISKNGLSSICTKCFYDTIYTNKSLHFILLFMKLNCN